MEIVEKRENDVLTLSVKGRLDTNTAPELEKLALEKIEGVKQLVLDLVTLDYISSAGLRVILMLHKHLTGAGNKLVVSHPKDEVMEVFDMTGFSSFLNIEE
ncbi:MAG: STAS domain-containing protein [Bacilli bacterium]|nr:STAS domain-containing protein [Bacilli bacterium]